MMSMTPKGEELEGRTGASHPPLRAWHSMSERERAVWAAAFVTAAHHGVGAAHEADKVVGALAAIEWPETEEPEHRAARLTRGLTWEDFRSWYVVEWRLGRSGRAPKALPEARIREAYDIYVQCGSDFY